MAYAQRYGAQPVEILDRAALLFAFFAGCGGTALLKLYDAHVLLTAIYPVVVLLLYVCLCFFAGSLAAEPDGVGDNSYYLGFLFTLSSLAVTLFKIRNLSGIGVNGADGPDIIPHVISGFGVALTSTITGVFFRVLLMQLRRDTVARERGARLDLSKGTRDFHTAVTQASELLKDTVVVSLQHAKERNQKVDEITDRHAQQVAELTSLHAARVNDLNDHHATRMRELLEKQSAAFESSLQVLVSRLSDEIVGRLAADTDSAAAMLRSSASELSQSIAQVTLAQEENLPRFKGAQVAVEAALMKWRDSVEMQRTVSDDQIRAISDRSNHLVGAAEAQGSAITDATQLLLDQASSMSVSIQAQRAAFAESTQLLADRASLVAAVAASAAEMQRQAAALSAESLADQSQTLTLVTDSFGASFGGAVQKLAEQSALLAATCEAAMATMQDAALRIEQAAANREGLAGTVIALDALPSASPLVGPKRRGWRLFSRRTVP